MPTVAAITPTTCQCGWSGELLFSADEGWRKKCPGCGQALSRDGTHGRGRRWYGNRRFAGSEETSVTKGFHPREVPFVRKHITAGKISDQGDVTFSDRAEEQRFQKQFNKMAEKLGGMPEAEYFGRPIEGLLPDAAPD